MFTIDLLKGHGVPIKSKPGGTFLIAISFIVPVALASVVVGKYLHNRIVISTQKELLEMRQTKIEELAPQHKLLQSIKQQKAVLDACREEVADVIHWQIQWSPLLQALLEHLPDSAAITELEARKRLVTKKVPYRKSPEHLIPVRIPERVLAVSFQFDASEQDDTDELVNEFCHQLLNAHLPATKINDVQPAVTTVDEKHISYLLECKFGSFERL